MSDEYLKSPLSASDPQGYMDAPALMVTSRKTGDPHAVEQSIAAVEQYQPLSNQDLQVVQRELSILSGRLEEVEQQLGVERKMGEAASLLGKLHQQSAVDSNKRKSIFKTNPKRLSKQADEEAQVSKDRINRLEFARTELAARKLGLENRLLRHHAAVLAKALSGEPLNPRPLSIALPSHVAASYGERSPRRLSRRLSTFDFDSGSEHQLQPQTPAVPPLHSGHHSRNTSISTQFGEPDAHQELNGIAKRIETALPTVTPNPNKSAFILSAFESLVREQSKNEKLIESLQLQAEQADQRIAFLSQKSKTTSETSPETARTDAENKQLKSELDQERKRLRELRDRVEAQRSELARVTKELEDVTNIAVRSETRLRSSEQVIEQLERQAEEQQSQLAEKLSASLSSQKPSVLCKEFRQIIHDLTRKHYNEQRTLRSIQFHGSSGGSIDAAATSTPSTSANVSMTETTSNPSSASAPNSASSGSGSTNSRSAHGAHATISSAA